MGRPWKVLSLFFLFILRANCDCRSEGWDYVHGGTYCIDTRKSDFFSFGTGFRGCDGGVDPILINPNNDDFICSKIQTNPDDVEMTSTCDVSGEEVRKSDMMSGNWIVVIEGLTFAWMRQFSIIAGPPAEVTSTPAITLTLTSTPVVTSTEVSTSTISETLPPRTITVPATTKAVTRTSTPARVTSTKTVVKTYTLPAWPPVVTKVTTTKTLTTSCRTQPPRNDPTCTIRPAKAFLAAASATPLGRFRRSSWPRAAVPVRDNVLAVRTPDLCTTTVLAEATTTTTTSTAPASTITFTSVGTATMTITPPPVTVQSGTAKVTVIITLPTPTRIVTKSTFTTTKTTATFTATITKTIRVPPSGVACLAK